MASIKTFIEYHGMKLILTNSYIQFENGYVINGTGADCKFPYNRFPSRYILYQNGYIDLQTMEPTIFSWNLYSGYLADGIYYFNRGRLYILSENGERNIYPGGSGVNIMGHSKLFAYRGRIVKEGKWMPDTGLSCCVSNFRVVTKDGYILLSDGEIYHYTSPNPIYKNKHVKGYTLFFEDGYLKETEDRFSPFDIWGNPYPEP